MPNFFFAVTEGFDKDTYFPKKATPLSTGYDVKAAIKEPLTIKPGTYHKIPLGFRVMCPENWWLELKPRSSTFAKKHLNCLYGTIDCDFEGTVLLACQYLPDVNDLGKCLVIEPGEAIGQIIPVKIKTVEFDCVSNEELDERFSNRKSLLKTVRGSGGFGSTLK